jgi:hypothetical protein
MNAETDRRRNLLVWAWCLAIAVGCDALAVGDDDAVTPVLPRIAVLELHNHSDYQGHMMGRRAAEALQIALESIGRWELIERAQVRQQCREMDLQPPFAVGYQQALAHRLGADMTITGFIEQVRISPGDGTVIIRLALDIVDRICGQSVASLQTQGSARRVETNPRPTDAIVSMALAATCRQAADIAGTVPVYSAVVADVSAGTVSLGSVQPTPAIIGDRLLLYRRTTEPVGHRLVGVLMVKAVQRERVQAAVMGKAGDLYTGDTAVCVGPMRPLR